MESSLKRGQGSSWIVVPIEDKKKISAIFYAQISAVFAMPKIFVL
jgi:hypothetical protein